MLVQQFEPSIMDGIRYLNGFSIHFAKRKNRLALRPIYGSVVYLH